jgi:ADP-ribose pyrophosphatase YjhB (NUDIX family)
MITHSCGALLYTIHNKEVYIVLGKEYGEWLPFKGRKERNETYEMAASREIEEETCKLINVNPTEINLSCNFSSGKKCYHIALIHVAYNTINKFDERRLKMTEDKYLEKTDIKLFTLKEAIELEFHYVTKKTIEFYYEYLEKLQSRINRFLQAP